MYNKRIVCDLDDTISVTKDRDWVNAEPNQQIIDKINYLYDLGWEIIILTARGQLSCGGDYERAGLKYRSQIEEWLSRHKVKYHELSFNKILATYYVDDKNLSLQEFINIDIKKLKSGWSGADVELRNGRIYKTGKDSLNASKWYKIAGSFFNVPKVYSLIGDTICLEFIEQNSPLSLQKVIKVIELFKEIPVPKEDLFHAYIERIKAHCEFSNKFFEIIPFLEGIQSFCNDNNSFCHGDLTVENILMNNGEPFLIDPIYDEGYSYSSYLLDITKFAYSLRKHKLQIEYDYFMTHFQSKIPLLVLIILELSHWIRVYKYAPEDQKKSIENTINEILTVVKLKC
jgi:capsule biosynthesis phosphatase